MLFLYLPGGAVFSGPTTGSLFSQIRQRTCLIAHEWLCIGFAHSTSLTSALLFRGLMGVGAAFATVSYLKLAAMWFSDKQYSLVAGLLATAAGVGSMMGQAPLAYSVAHSSWQHTLILCSIVGTVIAVLYALVVKDKPPLQPSRHIAQAIYHLMM